MARTVQLAGVVAGKPRLDPAKGWLEFRLQVILTAKLVGRSKDVFDRLRLEFGDRILATIPANAFAGGLVEGVQVLTMEREKGDPELRIINDTSTMEAGAAPAGEGAE